MKKVNIIVIFCVVLFLSHIQLIGARTDNLTSDSIIDSTDGQLVEQNCNDTTYWKNKW